MAICGKCHTKGVSVDHVKNCYSGKLNTYHVAPAPKPTKKAFPSLPDEGRYAVAHNGTVTVFLLRKAKKVTGWTVCTVHGDTRTFRGLAFKDGGTTVKGGSRDALLMLMDNPQQALVNYGKMTGKCGICGKGLTDPVSVEKGIGPVCIKSVGGVLA